ncbi:MAG: four helix bundle protein [Candidatus Saccharimonadales bacterium]
MSNIELQITKPRLLEPSTVEFAQACRLFIAQVPRSISNIEDCKQLARSSWWAATNYIEVKEVLSKKDFALRIKVCQKEAKESILWLEILRATEGLLAEDRELMKVFGSIVEKCK